MAQARNSLELFRFLARPVESGMLTAFWPGLLQLEATYEAMK